MMKRNSNAHKIVYPTAISDYIFNVMSKAIKKCPSVKISKREYMSRGKLTPACVPK